MLRGRATAVAAGGAALTVVTVLPLGLQSVLVRVAFVVLWLSTPWLATRGLTHVAARVGATGSLLRTTTTIGWVAAAALWGGLTPRLLGGSVDVRWALVGAAVGAGLLLALDRVPWRGRGDDEDDDEPWRRGPFL